MNKDYYTTEEAANVLGTHQKTVARWAAEGRFVGAYMPLGSRRKGWRLPVKVIDDLAAGYPTLDDLPPAETPATKNGGKSDGS
jgi:excisionase family DNA binding protein